jgi:hypothetical protein
MPAATPPGPRPENQRKRTELVKPRRSLIGMLAVVAIAAVAFVVLRRSDDHFLGLPPEYPSGFVIALLIAAAHAAAAMLLVIRAPHARLAAGLAAALLVVTSVGVIVLMLGVPWVPALLFFIGFVEILLVAASTPRKPAHRKHVPGR